MIKPEELRIGNWVDVTNASKIFTNHGDGKFTEYSRATYVRVSDISLFILMLVIVGWLLDLFLEINNTKCLVLVLLF